MDVERKGRSTEGKGRRGERSELKDGEMARRGEDVVDVGRGGGGEGQGWEEEGRGGAQEWGNEDTV